MEFDSKRPTRFAARYAALDGALTAEEVAVRLGVGIAAVNERAGRRQLAVLREGGAWRFPAWQFTRSGTLPGLVDLLDGWPGTIVALSRWACSSRPGLLGRTPATVLSENDVSAVMRELALHPPR
jgi:hypothetical protein